MLAGDVDWAAVKKALDEIEYDDVLTAELAPYSINPYQLAEDASRHMDVILASGSTVGNHS